MNEEELALIAQAELELEQERAAAATASAEPPEPDFNAYGRGLALAASDASSAERMIPFIGPALSGWHDTDLFGLKKSRFENLKDEYPIEQYPTGPTGWDATRDALLDDAGTVAKAGAMLIPGLAAARYVGAGADALIGANSMGLFSSAAANTAGAAAGELGGFLYDQAAEGLGLQEGQMTFNPQTGKSEPTSWKTDLLNAAERIPLDAGIGMLAEGLTSVATSALDATKRGMNSFRSKLDFNFDKERRLAAAFNDGTAASDQTGALTNEMGQGPIGEATKRARGYTFEPYGPEEIAAMKAGGMTDAQIAAQNSKKVLDVADVKGSQPFEKTTANIEAARHQTGQQIDEFVDTLEKQVPYGRVTNEGVVADRTTLASAGKESSTASRVITTEIESAAAKSLPPSELVELKQFGRTIDTLGKRQVMAEATSGIEGAEVAPLTESEAALLDHAQQRVGEILQKVNMEGLSGKELLGLKRSFAEAADFSRKGSDVTQSAIYTDLALNAEKQLSAQILAEKGPEALAKWKALNQQYQDLNRMGPIAARNANTEMSAITNPIPGIDQIRGVFTSKGASLYARPSNSVPDSTTNLRRGMMGLGASKPWSAANTAAGVVGNVAGGASNILSNRVPGLLGTGTAMARSPGVDSRGPGMIPDANAEVPVSTDHLPASMTIDLHPPTAQAKPGFQLPRNISLIDPQGLANMIGVGLPPELAQPIIFQWRQIEAKGDPVMKAKFIGALSEAYPDFPIQRGLITGLSSEFDLGDGKPRLFAPHDIEEWEKKVSTSPLRNDEKALRIMELRRDGTVYPLDRKLSRDVNPQEMNQQVQQKVSLNTAFQASGGMNPRQRNSFGSRRVE